MKYTTQRFVSLTLMAFFAYFLIRFWNDVVNEKFNIGKFIALIMVAVGLLLIIASNIRAVYKQYKYKKK